MLTISGHGTYTGGSGGSYGAGKPGSYGGTTLGHPTVCHCDPIHDNDNVIVILADVAAPCTDDIVSGDHIYSTVFPPQHLVLGAC